MVTIAVDISASAVNQETTLGLRESFRELRAYCDRLEEQIDEVNTRMIDEHVRGEQWRQKFEEANVRAAYLGERLTTFIRENRAGSPFPEFMPIYRHKKRGSTYDIIGNLARNPVLQGGEVSESARGALLSGSVHNRQRPTRGRRRTTRRNRKATIARRRHSGR